MMSATLPLSVEVEGADPPVVRVTGEADFHNRQKIYDAVKDLIDGGHANVKADLSELSYMDSSALATLVRCAAEVRGAGGSMELTGASGHVARVLTQRGAGLFFRDQSDRENTHGSLAGKEEDGYWRVSDFALPACPKSALIARQQVTDLVSTLPMGVSDGADVMIAFGEAVTNAIRHGCNSNPSQRITVRCVAWPGQLAIDVTDPGPGFCPDDIPLPTSRSILDGGMGIYIMRELMDEVEFLFNGGTTARLVKRIRTA